MATTLHFEVSDFEGPHGFVLTTDNGTPVVFGVNALQDYMEIIKSNSNHWNHVELVIDDEIKFVFSNTHHDSRGPNRVEVTTRAFRQIPKEDEFLSMSLRKKAAYLSRKFPQGEKTSVGEISELLPHMTGRLRGMEDVEYYGISRSDIESSMKTLSFMRSWKGGEAEGFNADGACIGVGTYDGWSGFEGGDDELKSFIIWEPFSKKQEVVVGVFTE
jgi:hypothetical protein